MFSAFAVTCLVGKYERSSAFYAGWDGVQGTVIVIALPERNKKHQNTETFSEKISEEDHPQRNTQFDCFRVDTFSPFGVVVVIVVICPR
jgi:hypothetical protein